MSECKNRVNDDGQKPPAHGLRELTDEEQKDLDSFPDDFVARVFGGEWWDGKRWWTAQTAVRELNTIRERIAMVRVIADRESGRWIDDFEERGESISNVIGMREACDIIEGKSDE